MGKNSRSKGPADQPTRPPRGQGETTPSALAARLLAHYHATRRDLPWRQDTDPYRVWVSEVMLQQTRVETVVPYYKRWLERFPGVAALADAADQDVLKQWEGLGYYSRARNLQRAARLVRERHGGELPSDPQLLRELPGFGAYTVGAVASIAFGHPLPAVDGNVRRVLARLYDVAQPGAAWLQETAAALVPAQAPGDFNQALMEFGATICTPRAPHCEPCPLADLCLARARGTVQERPGPKRRPAVRTAHFGTAVIGDPDGRMLLVRNGEDGLLGGLWGFPCAELRAGESAAEAAARAAAAAGVPDAGEVGEIDTVRHDFSHLRAFYHPVLFRAAAPQTGGPDATWAWAGAPELAALPLAVAQRNIAELAARSAWPTPAAGAHARDEMLARNPRAD